MFTYFSCCGFSVDVKKALMFSKDISVLCVSQSWHFVNITPDHGWIMYARFRCIVTELCPKQLGTMLEKYIFKTSTYLILLEQRRFTLCTEVRRQ